MAQSLLELDSEALTWVRLQKRYVRELMSLGKDYLKKKDMLAALEVYGHVLEVDPHQRAARTAMRNVRRTGGREVVTPVSSMPRPVRCAHIPTKDLRHILPWQGPMVTVL